MRRILLVVALAAACDNNPGTTGTDAPPTQCDDVDGDGVTTCDGDCDDTTALTAPGNDELCGDGEDNDCNGETDEDCAAGVGTFVSTMTGNDANTGTATMPVKTIAKGIANAMLLGGERSVIVAEGVYNEKVTLAQGIDLLGGHQCNATACAWTRDIMAFRSAIQNPDFEGVLAGAGITQTTLISGFSINGNSGQPTTTSGTCAMTLNGGSPTIRGNTIVAGNVTGSSGNDANNRSIGIAVRGTTDAAGALIENNDITSNAGAQSVGIAIESTSPSITSLVKITSNTIRSGTARRSVGVFALRAAAGSTLSNNDITGGSSQSGSSLGVQIGSPITADRNRINLDRTTAGTCTQTTSWCAGMFVEGATTTITNNVVIGPKGQKTTGIVLAELETPAGLVTVANNYFDGGGSGPNSIGGSRNASSAMVLQISNNSMANLTGMVGRIGNNILSGGNNADRFGIREDAPANRTIHPIFVNANLFFFTAAIGRSDAIYREIGSSGIPIDYSAVFLFEGNSGIPAAKNDEGDPLLDASWHTADGSPCIDQGTAVDAPAKDFEGDARPAGQSVDVGHDEH